MKTDSQRYRFTLGNHIKYNPIIRNFWLFGNLSPEHAGLMEVYCSQVNGICDGSQNLMGLWFNSDSLAYSCGLGREGTLCSNSKDHNQNGRGVGVHMYYTVIVWVGEEKVY